MTLSTEPALWPLDELARSGRALLISLRPRFAEAILDGTKTVELRRRAPRLPTGALVVLYATSPVRAIVGWARVESIVSEALDDLWLQHGHHAGVSRMEFMRYFRDLSAGKGLLLRSPQRADTPMALRELRRLGVRPPQSWQYLEPSLASQISASLSAQSASRHRAGAEDPFATRHPARLL